MLNHYISHTLTHTLQTDISYLMGTNIITMKVNCLKKNNFNQIKCILNERYISRLSKVNLCKNFSSSSTSLSNSNLASKNLNHNYVKNSWKFLILNNSILFYICLSTESVCLSFSYSRS